MTTLCEVTAIALNLRAGASGTSTVLTVLRRGQVCVTAGAAVNGWLPVVFDRFSGFVFADYVRSLAATDQQVVPTPLPPGAASPGPGVPVVPAPGVEVKLRDRVQLHPDFRTALDKLLAQAGSENIPFRIFEAFRTPERQEWLFAQGRTRSGSVVTKARAWESFHQYGMAADLVLFIDGQWSWSDAGPLGGHWHRLREMARDVGLRTLDWEAPHVEWPVTIAEATGAPVLASADEGWRDNLEAVCACWRRAGGSGGPVRLLAERPALPDLA